MVVWLMTRDDSGGLGDRLDRQAILRTRLAHGLFDLLLGAAQEQETAALERGVRAGPGGQDLTRPRHQLAVHTRNVTPQRGRGGAPPRAGPASLGRAARTSPGLGTNSRYTYGT